MNNNRTLKRRQLAFYLPVVDRNTDTLVGHLADITAEGIMTVGKERLKPDTVFQLRIDLPKEVLGKTQLAFDARVLWCRPDLNPDLQAAGFELLDTQGRDVETIVGVINTFLLPD